RSWHTSRGRTSPRNPCTTCCNPSWSAPPRERSLDRVRRRRKGKNRASSSSLRSRKAQNEVLAISFSGGRRTPLAQEGDGRELTAVLAVQTRRCRELKYASQSEASHWRAKRKAL